MEAPTTNEMKDWSKKILEEIQNTRDNLENTRCQVKGLKLSLKKFQILSGIWGAVAALVIIAIIMTSSIFSNSYTQNEEQQISSHFIKSSIYRIPE